MQGISKARFVGFELQKRKKKDGTDWTFYEIAFAPEKGLRNLIFRENLPLRAEVDFKPENLRAGGDYMLMYELNEQSFVYHLRLVSVKPVK